MFLLLIASLVSSLAPVVIIPGIAGSRMMMKLKDAHQADWWCLKDADWWGAWISLLDLQPENIDCFNDQFSVHFDKATGTYSNTSGVEIQPVPGLDGLMYLDSAFETPSEYFYAMVTYLENKGYISDVNLHGATYDWRFGPAGLDQLGYFDNLKATIENTVTANGERAVLVSHSLGSLVTQAFLSMAEISWTANHIKAWFPIAGPFGGASVTAEGYVSGYVFKLSPWIPNDYLRPVERSAPSGVVLLPQSFGYGEDFVVIVTPSKNYTASVDSMRDMLIDLGLEKTIDIYDFMRKVQAQTDQLALPPAGLPIYVYYGSGIPTLETAVYNTDLSSELDKKPSSQLYGDGDGTVPAFSVITPVKKWPGYAGGFIKITEVPKVEHMHMVNQESIFEDIFKVASGSDLKTGVKGMYS